jgi:phosphatidylinositol glycan class B
MRGLRDPDARAPLWALLAVTCVTAYFSYAYFHLDEYVQIVEPALRRAGLATDTTVPWEYGARMRSWLQPGLYVAVTRMLGAVGLRDVFSLVFVWRLLTGLAGWAALCALVGTSARWFERDEERRAHVRVAAMLGFLPYLLVRTSQESLSASAFTLAFALLLWNADPAAPPGGNREQASDFLQSSEKWLLSGALCGVAFELRFQTALLTLGFVAWLRFVARAPWRRLAEFAAGGVAVLAIALLVDRWGYGAWALPPVEYVRANLVDGVADLFGVEPPFAYFYLMSTNVFMPVVGVLLVAMLVAWWRHPRHAVTWITVPFFLVHSLLAHKEERFLFPMILLATTFPALAFAPGYGRPMALARRVWGWRRGTAVKLLAAWNFAVMALLAVYPLGWNHHVPFARFLRERLREDLRAYALEDIELFRVPYGPLVYDIEKGSPAEIAAALKADGARGFLIADTPRLRTGEEALDARCTLVYSEFPFWRSDWLTDRVMREVDRYNEAVRLPLHPIRWRSLYRIRR